MFGKALSNVATHMAGSAVGGLARSAALGAATAIFLIAAFILLILIAFWYFEPMYGAIPVAFTLAVFCITVALALIMAARGSTHLETDAGSTATEAVALGLTRSTSKNNNQPDYMAALQVIIAGFMFGMEAARHLRRR